MSAFPKSYLTRMLGMDLRKVGSFMPLDSQILGSRFSLRLTREQAAHVVKTVDRAALLLDKYAELLAREEGKTVGPLQTNEERAARAGRGGRPKKTPAEAGAE